jgi:hypothetical protein
MKKLIYQTKQHMSTYPNLNARVSAFAINIPNVANIGNKNFRAANWPYAYTSTYNSDMNNYRKHPTKGYIIARNKSTRIWRPATKNEINNISKRGKTYANRKSF